MVSVDVLEVEEDDEDDTDDDDVDDDDEGVGDVGGFGGPTVELSKLLEVSEKRGVFDDPDDNDFEDPDARLVELILMTWPGLAFFYARLRFVRIGEMGPGKTSVRKNVNFRLANNSRR